MTPALARPKKQVEDRLDPVMIRMPQDLHQAIKDKAAAEERSMAQTIRYALKLYVGLAT